jgi:hypothetical protein
MKFDECFQGKFGEFCLIATGKSAFEYSTIHGFFEESCYLAGVLEERKLLMVLYLEVFTESQVLKTGESGTKA